MSTTYPLETNNGVATSWIPLTTGWSASSDCGFSCYLLYRSISDNLLSSQVYLASAFVTFDPLEGLAGPGRPPCLPSEISIWKTQFTTYYDWQDTTPRFGSPDKIISIMPLRCPDAWSTVATFVKSGSSIQAMCCPPSYFLSNSAAFSTGVEGFCASSVLPGQSLNFVYASDATDLLESQPPKASLSSMQRTILGFLTTLTSPTFAYAAPIVGWNMESNAIQTSNPVPNQIITKIVTSFSTQTHSFSPKMEYGMSSGAKAGIAVSAGVGIFIAIILISWTVRLRRRNRKLSTQIKIHDEFHQIHSSDLDPNGGIFVNPPQPYELRNSHINELRNHEIRREIGGSQINELGHRSMHELDTTLAPVRPAVAAAASPRAASGDKII